MPRTAHLGAHQPDLVALQQTAGNQAVLRWIGGGVAPTEETQPAPEKEAGPGKHDMGTPVKDAEETFYPIQADKLSDVLAKFKFRDKKGKPLAAETTWDVKNAFPVAKKGKEWQADPITWTQKVKVELPEWSGFSTASETDKQEWARFLKATRLHEQGHVDRVKQFLEKDMTEEHKKAAAPTKKQLVANLKQKTKEVGDKLKEISEKYDAETTHGATQGATLNPSSGAKP